MSSKPLPDSADARARQRQANLRMGLILGSLAATFFFGFVVKMVLLNQH